MTAKGANSDDAATSVAAPMATVESERGQRRLAAVCPQAEALGLHPGQALAQANAILPGLLTFDADPAADVAALAALAGWCTRYTPLVAADPPEGLWLDIAGCAHLWGHEAALADDLLARLRAHDLPAHLAVAGSAGAAWALARMASAREATLLRPGEEATALATLPISLLRLDPRVITGLRRVGLTSIGALARLPRAELAARFGPMPGRRLDQAFGTAAEVIGWA
jgi:protein ImuB